MWIISTYRQTTHGITITYFFSAPSKPKFIEQLLNRVSSKKAGVQDRNGLINPQPADASDDFVVVDQLSSNSECLEAVESLAEELIACSQRPASGESCDSGQGSLLESTCDFSPTQHHQSWSTPTSPRFHGIVKQRLKSFQTLRENSSNPENFDRKQKRAQSCKEGREINEAQRSLKKIHCSLVEDDKFTQAMMESGYVKALVSKLNKSPSFDKDDDDSGDESQRESGEIVNGVKVKLNEESVDDWPDEFSGDSINDSGETDAVAKKYRSPSVKDQLLKFETDVVKSKLSVTNVSSKRKPDKPKLANKPSKSVLNGSSDSHAKDLDNSGNFHGAVGAVSSESLTNSEKSTRTLSESQVSRALKRFNHERHKHISSRLTSTASSSYSSLHNNLIKSPPILRRPKSSDTAMPNANNTLHGANAKYFEKSRSVEYDRSSDTASSSPVSCSFDFGLLPLSPEELFDQNWSKSEFTFDDFSDESEHDGINLSKQKVTLMS